jgi:hypothetical protein
LGIFFIQYSVAGYVTLSGSLVNYNARTLNHTFCEGRTILDNEAEMCAVESEQHGLRANAASDIDN